MKKRIFLFVFALFLASFYTLSTPSIDNTDSAAVGTQSRKRMLRANEETDKEERVSTQTKKTKPRKWWAVKRADFKGKLAKSGAATPTASQTARATERRKAALVKLRKFIKQQKVNQLVLNAAAKLKNLRSGRFMDVEGVGKAIGKSHKP